GMRVLGDSWCFCNGAGKSERMKAAIFSGKSPAMARVNASSTGFLIHRNLLLTTHATLPSAAAAEAAEIRLTNGVAAYLFPNRFFITSSVLDLTVVGLDVMDGDSNTSQQLHCLKACPKPNLDLGSMVFLLGYAGKQELLAVGEGKLVIATDNLIKLTTDGITWNPGSAGFDLNGNLAFMVCDPMKLATSPNTKYSSTSSSSPSSWNKDCPMQFGIPIPVILDWLNQHWEGNLDELSKPKLPLKRLVSSGMKSELSCASFTLRRVFKSNEEGTPSSSPATISRPAQQNGNNLLIANPLDEEHGNAGSHVPGIQMPEIICDSPMLNERSRVHLLDINFPPRIVAKPPASPRKTDPCPQKPEPCPRKPCDDIEAESTGSVNGAAQESMSSHADVSSEIPRREECNNSSDGETTMYSAETAESRNIPSPPCEGKFHRHAVGRSQSCVNNYYNGLSSSSPVQKYRGSTMLLEKHPSFTQSHRKAAVSTSQRSNDYFSPTVSSIMKKRNNNLELQNRPRQSA
ncbi:hypothetical protein M569_06084, partial [Genlisea aurea]